MKIYAIKDQLINYFMTPFAAPGDKEVMAAIAAHVNHQTGVSDALSEAPHHFQIWQLGNVTEDGHIEPGLELVCDCASLIRAAPTKLERGELRKIDPPRTGQANGAGAEIGAGGSPGATPG